MSKCITFNFHLYCFWFSFKHQQQLNKQAVRREGRVCKWGKKCQICIHSQWPPMPSTSQQKLPSPLTGRAIVQTPRSEKRLSGRVSLMWGDSRHSLNDWPATDTHAKHVLWASLNLAEIQKKSTRLCKCFCSFHQLRVDCTSKNISVTWRSCMLRSFRVWLKIEQEDIAVCVWCCYAF